MPDINKLVKIFLALLAIILLIAIVFLIFNKKSSTKPTETSPAPAQTSSQAVPAFPEAKQQQTTANQKSSAEQSYTIEKQNAYSYDALKDDPEIISSIRNTKNDFKLDDIGVSLPSAMTKLKNGNEILLLSGCQPHNCGGTETIVAYNKTDKKSYVLAEKIGSAAGYEIFGNPPEEIKNLLVYYFNNNE